MLLFKSFPSDGHLGCCQVFTVTKLHCFEILYIFLYKCADTYPEQLPTELLGQKYMHI